MRESRSSGSVGERGGNDPLYPDYFEAIGTRPSLFRLEQWS